MTDRTVSVILQARVTDYMAKFSAASKATDDFARKVDVAKGRAAQGYHAIGVAGVAMGTVVAGGFALAVKASADFEAKMALVRTLSHATGAEMSQLSGAALHVGQAYGYTASQVADAEAELVKAGVSVSDMMGGALTGALTLASAGQTDVATATTIAATAMTQFALKGKDVPHIADLLAAGADKALGSVVDLGYALDQAGPTAHQFGVSLEETVGTLAAFAQSGQIGERGGTILTQMLLKLTAPSKQASDILKQLGISIYGANGQFVGMSNLAGQLHDKLGNLTLAERNHDLAVIFGSRAIRGANILYQEGAQGIEDWTTKVNAQGFAALQAAGKLDSLSGDVTKLKAALQTAFIGAGAGAQGPLRTMVQDVTKLVEVWTGLPGPVRDGAEALILAGGAITLVGGAALLFIPKWTAMNAALKETGVGAISARGALATLGKGLGVAAAVYGLYEGAKALGNALAYNTTPSVNQFTSALIDLQHQSGPGASALVAFTKELAGLSGTDAATFLPKLTKNLDAALSGLVTGGHLDVAQADFAQMTTILHGAGMTTAQVTKLFPQFASALSDSATSAKVAGNGVDQYGNAVSGAAKKTKSATDAAKHYSDALHALADPLFAMNQALQAVTDAQDAARKAVKKYGEDSPQARQANLDLASSALDAEAAARTLAASVKDGSVTIGAARKYLKAWVADGLLTKQQADDVSASFDHLIGRAQTISGLHPHLTVTADTSQAEAALTHLFNHIGQVINRALQLGPTTNINSNGGVGNATYGPAVPKGKTKGASQSTSGGSTATTPTTSDSGYYVPGGGSSGGGGGSGGSGGKSKSDKPPTVQEIVHAILTGTIPPSIDKLSKVLQHEISHLSGVVANAEQYRSTIRSSLTGYAGLANMGTGTAGTDLLGASGPAGKGSVNAYLKDRGSKLKQFAHLLNRLDREGLSPDLLSQFVQVGPDAIPAMQELLSTGHRGIRRADHLEARIRRYAGQATQTAVTDRYATALVRSVDRLPSRLQYAVTQGLRHARFEVSFTEGDRRGGHHVRVGH